MKFIKELLQVTEAEVADAEDDEQPKKKPTKTKQKSNLDDLNLSGPSDANLPANAPKDTPPSSAPKQNTASRAETLRRTPPTPLGPDAMRHLRDLHANMPADGEEEDVDMGAEPTEPPPPDTLPAVIQTHMAAAGYLDPQFHLVANLPGNMSSAIRRLGKALFAQFTSTPTDKISMVASLGGMGPNTPREVNAVAAYCKSHGVDLGPGEVDFDQIMPGYKAEIHNFEAHGVHYMMVKDFMGHYIYSWPANTSTLKSKPEQKKLK